MDLIDRQEVLAETDKWLNDLLEDDSAKDIRVGIRMVRVYMKQMSAVQPRNMCEGCKYLPRFCNEEPCVSCSNNYENKWKGETDGSN